MFKLLNLIDCNGNRIALFSSKPLLCIQTCEHCGPLASDFVKLQTDITERTKHPDHLQAEQILHVHADFRLDQPNSVEMSRNRTEQ